MASIRCNIFCDIYGICPYAAEYNHDCEYWCGADEPEDNIDWDFYCDPDYTEESEDETN